METLSHLLVISYSRYNSEVTPCEVKLNVVLSAVFVLLESSRFWREVWHVYQNSTSGCWNVLQETINVKNCIQRRHNK